MMLSSLKPRVVVAMVANNLCVLEEYLMKLSKPFVLAIVLTMIFTGSTYAQTGKLQPFQFPDEKFSIMFPSNPEKSTTQQGSIEYSCTESNGSYSVLVLSLPAGITDLQEVLNTLEASMLAEIKAKVISKTPVQLQGYSGRQSDFVTILPGKLEAKGRSFMCIVKPRIYWVCAIGTKPWFASSPVAQFFKSFSVTPDK